MLSDFLGLMAEIFLSPTPRVIIFQPDNALDSTVGQPATSVFVCEKPSI
jgi:hypothetical protein